MFKISLTKKLIFLLAFFVFGFTFSANAQSSYWKNYFSSEERKAVVKNAEKYTLSEIESKSEKWKGIIRGYNIKKGSITDENIKENGIGTDKISGLGDYIDGKISNSSTPQDFSADNLTGTYAALDGSQITDLNPANITGSGNLNIGNGDLFVDDVSGNVGIGTTSPSTNLDVSGDMSIGGVHVYGGFSDSQWIVNSEYNSIDSSPTANILGGGRSGWANIIGTTGMPHGSGYAPTDYSADTGYIEGSADVATIAGGYDNVVNQEAGVIVGGGHNFVKYNIEGHSMIGGGSYNVISGGRSGIFSGSRNTITGPSSTFNFIGGGDDNNIIDSYSVIPGGLSNSVNGSVSFAFGRRIKNLADGAVGLSDDQDADFNITTDKSFNARFKNGFYLYGDALSLIGEALSDGSLFTLYDSTSDQSLYLKFNTGIPGLVSKHIDIQGASSAGDLSFSPSSDTRAALVLKDGGNVGIGTTDPKTKLEVDGIIKTKERSIATCNADAKGGIYFDSDDNHFYGCNGTIWVQLDN